MIYITYWEVNPELSIKDVAMNLVKARKEGRWPPPGQEILAFYVTPSKPMWGIAISKAESEETVFKSLIELTREMPDLFVKFRASPARTVEDVIKLALE